MRSLRLLTLLLVVLVLVPAGVLAGMGIWYGARLDEMLGREVERDLDAAELRLRGLLSGLDAAVERELLRPVELEAEDVRRGFAARVWARWRSRLLVDPPGSFRPRRIVDASGHSLYPRTHVPSDGLGEPVTWEDRIDRLRRRADHLLYAENDPDAALEVWRSARREVREDRLLAGLEAEEALLRCRLDARPGCAAEAWRTLSARWNKRTLPSFESRSVLLLLLRAAREDAHEDPTLSYDLRAHYGTFGEPHGVRTPLTDSERWQVLARVAGIVIDGPEGQRLVPRQDSALLRGTALLVSVPIAGGARYEVAYDKEAILSAYRQHLAREAGFGAVRIGVDGGTPTPGSQPSAPDAFRRSVATTGALGVDAVFTLTHHRAGERSAVRSRQARWIALGVIPLFGAVFVGAFLVRRAVRREMEARRLRDDFMANVSHELRTPLTSVCLHAEMLAEEDVPPDRRRSFARVVQAEGARLMTLVDDLLDFAALARGQRRLEPEPVDLAEAARRAVLPFRALAEREGVDLAVEGADRHDESRSVKTAEPVALADAHATSRILANLVANAWKHGRPSRDGGPGRIRVRVYDGAVGPTVDVSDDGPGIAAEERGALFERFRRGRGAEGTTGTGLGLALSRDLARAMGGDLVHVPDAGETLFRLTLPPLPAETP